MISKKLPPDPRRRLLSKSNLKKIRADLSRAQIMQPTNRELAVLVTLGLFIVAGLTQRDLRKAFYSVLRAAVHWKVLPYLLGYLLVVIGLSQILEERNIWSWDQSATLILWIMFTGFPIVSSFDEVGKNENLFQDHFRSVIGLSAIVSVVLELRSFSLPIEFVLLVLLIFAALSEAFTTSYAQRYENLPAGCWNRVILVIFAAMLINSLLWLVRSATMMDVIDTLSSFATSVVWTLGSLAVLWTMSVVSTYELAFGRIDWAARGVDRDMRASKWALFLGIRFDLQTLTKFVIDWPEKMVAATTFSDARHIVEEFRQTVKSKRRERDRYRSKLIANAGAGGADEFGYCLDLREFKETMRMLDRLWTFHSGQYHAEMRFRPDVVDMLAHGWGSDELPFPYGIEQVIGDDGQSFYAYRQTVGGWYFGVAGKVHGDKVPDEYYYDGAIPPQPLESDCWDIKRGGQNSRHWGLNFWDPEMLSTNKPYQDFER